MPSKLLVLVLFLAGAPVDWAQALPSPAKQPFTVETMLKLSRIGEPVLSPDGLQVAFSVQTVDVVNNTKPTQKSYDQAMSRYLQPRGNLVAMPRV